MTVTFLKIYFFFQSYIFDEFVNGVSIILGSLKQYFEYTGYLPCFR